jgi:hypothetical protein
MQPAIRVFDPQGFRKFLVPTPVEGTNHSGSIGDCHRFEFVFGSRNGFSSVPMFSWNNSLMQNILRKVDIYGPSKLQRFPPYKTLIFHISYLHPRFSYCRSYGRHLVWKILTKLIKVDLDVELTRKSKCLILSYEWPSWIEFDQTRFQNWSF